MIASDLVMTNNHVLASQVAAATADFTFNYQLDRTGKTLEPASVGALLLARSIPTRNWITRCCNCASPPFGSPLLLRPEISKRDARVAIIQHPGGQFKKISMQNNFVAYADRLVVQYTTTTLPGSSGAPVLNDNFEVVAIHREGGWLPEPGGNQRFLRNGGTSLLAILGDLEVNAPQIRSRLH
jgi:hypothetical protein